MSFYAPSILSQLLVPICVLLGGAGGLYAAWELDAGAIVSTVLAMAAALGAAAMAWYAYGSTLTFDVASRAILIRRRLFGIKLGQRRYTYDEIQELTLNVDGDGFEIIGLKLLDGRKYSFCGRKTRDQYERLCGMLGREHERERPRGMAAVARR